jgi:UDP-glucuronate 4-epimerase
VDDIVHGILSSLDRPLGFRLFNLGNSRTVVLRDLISLIEKSLGKEAKIRLLPAQPGDVPITFADISRAEKLLNYSPVTSIEQGIPRFVDWYLKKTEDF